MKQVMILIVLVMMSLSVVNLALAQDRRDEPSPFYSHALSFYFTGWQEHKTTGTDADATGNALELACGGDGWIVVFEEDANETVVDASCETGA